jgi:hypothetical protein
VLGVALARSAPGQRWPEPGEAVNLIVSGIGERLGGMLRQPDHRDTAAVLAIAGPLLLAATAGRTIAGPFMLDPALTPPHVPPRMLVTAVVVAAWWTLVALGGMLRWRRVAAAGLPAFVTTALVCWGFQGFLPTGPPFGPLMLSPLQWDVLVLVPAIGVVACFTGLRLYERLLRRRVGRP